jgi:hypothetical protein
VEITTTDPKQRSAKSMQQAHKPNESLQIFKYANTQARVNSQ